jgi:hypothetical protein
MPIERIHIDAVDIDGKAFTGLTDIYSVQTEDGDVGRLCFTSDLIGGKVTLLQAESVKINYCGKEDFVHIDADGRYVVG